MNIFAIIPSLAETQLVSVLQSLDCSAGGCNATVQAVVVFNAPPGYPSPDAFHRMQMAHLKRAKFAHIQVHCIWLDPEDSTGVGAARDAGFQWALARAKAMSDVLASLDADAPVSRNYCAKIVAHFGQNEKPQAAVCGYAHPEVTTTRNQAIGPLVQGICDYEAHLRMHIEGLRLAGAPNAFHTLGSACICNAAMMKIVGGIPHKQAGEDFYFLHKCAAVRPLGRVDAMVYPRGRYSRRTPFGTGPAVAAARDEVIHTYDPKNYERLASIVRVLRAIAGGDMDSQNNQIAQVFGRIESEKYVQAAESARVHSASAVSAQRRLDIWLGGIRTVRLLHDIRDLWGDEPAADVPVAKAQQWWLESWGLLRSASTMDRAEFVEHLRRRELGFWR